MAQTNFTPILTYKSDTASSVPSASNLTNSANGAELAVNTADKRLFTKDSGGNVVEVGTNPSSLTMPNGTANGVVYANGSKVLTSGSALTFNGTSLGIGSSSYGDAGTITASIGVAGTTAGGLQLWASSAQEHFIQWGDSTSGSATYAGAISYSHASDFMRFWVNSAEQMRLTSTGLGIGTSSPATKLHISGSTTPNLRFEQTNSSVVHQFQAASGNFFLNIDATNATGGSTFLIQQAGITVATLSASGNLGLGVTPNTWYSGTKALEIGATTALMDISGQTNLYQNAYLNAAGSLIYKTNNYATQYRAISGQHQFFTAASGNAGDAISFTQAMTLDASGLLQVGRTAGTSPDGKLQVSATGTGAGAANTKLGFALIEDDSGNGAGLWLGAMTNQNTGVIGSRTASGNIAFQTYNSGWGERARITYDGNLLVGTTSNNGRLSIQGSDTGSTNAFYVSNSTPALAFRIQNDGYINLGALPVSPYNNTTGSAANLFVDSGGGLARSTSSLKYKRDVQDADHGLTEVLALRPVTYKGKSDADGDKVFGGLIAEEVHAAGLTEFVQYADDGSPDALAYGNMVSLCIKAIQELKAEFDAYKLTHP